MFGVGRSIIGFYQRHLKKAQKSLKIQQRFLVYKIQMVSKLLFREKKSALNIVNMLSIVKALRE